MKKISFVVNEYFRGNRIFDISDPDVNRDNCQYPTYLLKEKFAQNGYDLSTDDINTPKDSVAVIYNMVPDVLPAVEEIDKSFLFPWENPVIISRNWNLKNHKYFKKVFTWNDDLVDNEKYVKVNLAYEIPQRINKDLNKKKKFVALIAANKSSRHKNALYGERVRTIRWFEKNHPEMFDLYGIGWGQEYTFRGNRIIRQLNRLGVLRRLMTPTYPSYRGVVRTKKEVLEKYKFSICYENATGYPGYITEKIFDCFFAACVPVYLGADNITDHIPSECFIDRREFESHEDLYKYLTNIENSEYLRYLDAIERFLNSDRSKEFSADVFTETVVSTVLDALKIDFGSSTKIIY